MKLRLRKDKLVSEDNVSYIAFGVNVYKGWKRVRVIKDISLSKKKLRGFVKQCNYNSVGFLHLDDVIQDYIKGESIVEEKPCFPK